MLVLHIWYDLAKSLKTKSFFKTFEKSLLSDWFRPKYKCKFSSYFDD